MGAKIRGDFLRSKTNDKKPKINTTVRKFRLKVSGSKATGIKFGIEEEQIDLHPKAIHDMLEEKEEELEIKKKPSRKKKKQIENAGVPKKHSHRKR